MVNSTKSLNPLPLITVVTVVYNSEATIERTIQSVLNLNYPNVEYIIIDGNSSDRTLDIILQYKDKISSVISESDKGVYDAMNKAIGYATGEWICFMNSGDIFHDASVLEKIFRDKVYTDKTGVIYGDAHLCDGSHFLKAYPTNPFWKSRMPYRTGKGICHQSMFTKTALAKKLKFDLSYKISADFNMAYQIYKREYSFIYVPIVVSDFDVIL